jgi:hypothetical protein
VCRVAPITPVMIVVRGPLALVMFVLVVGCVWWSFDDRADRVRDRRAATTRWLAIETPALATQLAIQQERFRARHGRYATDTGVLVDAWAAQVGGTSDDVRDLAARHPIEIRAGKRGHEVTAYVRDDDGPAYRLRVTASGAIERRCDDIAHEACRGGTWASLVEDRHLLPSR